MNSTDNTELNYICFTEAALGQATALANIPITGTESTSDLKTLLLGCRELLRCLDRTNVHYWELDKLVPSTDLASDTLRANKQQNSLDNMTWLAVRLASLETPRARPSYKPKEVKDPEPLTGIQTDLKCFKNQLALVLADVGCFTNIQHQLCYCFSLLKIDANTILEPYVSPSGVAFPDIEAFLEENTSIFGDSDENTTAYRELEKLK